MYCHLSLLVVLTSLLTVSATSPAAADAQPANLPTEIHHSPFAIRHLQQAAHYYNRYNALAPDDLLGLKRLTETCTVLEEAGVEDENCIAAAQRLLRITQYAIRDSNFEVISPTETPAAVLRDALAVHTDDRRIVAELLDVPMADVELGPNLVKNGGFEDWSWESPVSWNWAKMFNQAPFSNAVFTGGEDQLCPLKGQRSI
jgi:hypothetical protein